MLLIQKEEFKSIKELPSVAIPAFTVITGINGSGKSHLLEGIDKGALQLGELTREKGIKYFNTQLLLAQLEAPRTPVDQKKRRKEAVASVLRLIKQHAKHISTWFKNHRIEGCSEFSDLRWLASADVESLGRVLTSAKRAGSPVTPAGRGLPEAFIQQRRMWEQSVMTSIRQYGELPNILNDYVEREKRPLLSLDENDIDEALPLIWNAAEGISITFSEWFRTYHTAWERNRMHRYFAETLSEKRPWLSDEEFVRTFGPKPWEVANVVLEKCNALYRFKAPQVMIGDAEETFEVEITDVSGVLTKATISDLSTGEKTLLGIISLLYRASPGRSLGRLPKLLLLDEVDGPLHPAYTKPLMSVLQETLVEQCGITVLLVTHSPSTVAFAPDGSVFELNKSPRLLSSASRARAINTLTSGFITVLPSSRVIITESSFDADRYAEYYGVLLRRSLLPSDPPLSFLHASRQSDQGGGGKNEVEKWANKLSDFLSELGFYGLIDWDGCNVETDVIKVIGRHSVENYLLDPLTMVTLMIKEGVTSCFSDSSIRDMNFHRILSMDEAQAQRIIDEFCRFVEMKEPSLAVTQLVSSEYLGGRSLMLPMWTIDHSGHDLVKIFKAHLNPLSVSEKRPPLLPGSDPLSKVIEMQIVCLPDIISKDFIPLFESFQKPST